MLKIYCSGLWNNFDDDIDMSLILGDTFSYTLNYDEADLALYSFHIVKDRQHLEGPKKYYRDILHLHINWESEDRLDIYPNWNSILKNNERQLLLGLMPDTEKTLYFPCWLPVMSKIKEMNNLILNNGKSEFERRWEKNKGKLVSVASVYYSHREKIIDFYKGVRLNPKPGKDEKIKAISDYCGILAIENSKTVSGYYVTEKLSDAILAGCIPVYWGGDLFNTPFNDDRIIVINDLSAPMPYRLNDRSFLEELFMKPLLKNNWESMTDSQIKKIRDKIKLYL